MAGSSLMENLFQRTLEDLIKGLRLRRVGESAFLSKALDEIRREVKSTDADAKATAVLKLAYLSSLHFYDMSFAAFYERKSKACGAGPSDGNLRFPWRRSGYRRWWWCD